MTDARMIVYRLRAQVDPSSEREIRRFGQLLGQIGRDQQRIMGGVRRTGGGGSSFSIGGGGGLLTMPGGGGMTGHPIHHGGGGIGGGHHAQHASLLALSKEMKHASHGALELAHGLAFMGLAGEESTEKIFRGLLKIEGAMSILRGAGMLGKAGPLGIGLAAIGGAAALAHSVHGFSSVKKNEFGDKLFSLKNDPSSFKDNPLGRIMTLISNVGNHGEWSSIDQSTRKMIEAEKALAKTREHEGFKAAQTAIDSEVKHGLLQSLLSRRAEARGALGFHDDSDGGALSRIRAGQMDIGSALSASRGRLADFSKSGDRANELAERQRIIELEQRALDLTKDERDAQKELTQTLLTRASKMREFSMEQGRAYLSAKERFGNLSAPEQQSVLRAKSLLNRADRLGGSYHGRALRRQITREQQELLTRIGDESSLRGVRGINIERAHTAGFDTQFGTEERRDNYNFERAARALTNLAIKVTPQMNVEVKIEGRTELVDAITRNIININRQMGRDIEENLRKRGSGQMQALNDKRQAEANDRSQSARNITGGG